jgi:predicted MFS family arabinose efflux permease
VLRIFTGMLSPVFSLYKQAYSGLSRATWLLSTVMLVNRSGTMVLPFMTIYLTSPAMGYSIAQAGLVMGIFGLGAICGGFLGGRLTDRWGFHRVQLAALTGGGIAFMILGQVRSYPLICICTFLLSVVNDAFRPANSTAIATYSKEENRTRSYSLNRLAINLGWAAGGALGGILASINYHLLFWVDGGTNLAAALLLRMFLHPETTKAVHHAKEVSDKPVLSPYRDRTYLRFIVCTVLFASCFFQLFSTLPLFYKRVLGMPEYMIGLLLTINGLIIAVFEMVLVFKLEGKRENLFYVFFGVLAIGLSYLLLDVLPLSVYVAYFCMAVSTVGEMFAMSFLNSFWISRTSGANRGRYAGLYTIAWSTAQVIGPTGGAEIAQRAGFYVLWWAVGGTCLVAAVAFRYLRLRQTQIPVVYE